MKPIFKQHGRFLGMLALLLVLPWAGAQAAHDVRGITGGSTPGVASFNLYAFPFNMNLPDGSSVHMWGFGDMDGGANATHAEGNGYGLPQYPAPTLVVNEGDAVTINMTNMGVPRPVSMVVTGHEVSASGGAAGLFTRTSDASGTQTVSYTFTAGAPGTYVYHGLGDTNPGLHAEMGLQGVMIVRPTGYDVNSNRIGYPEIGADYDQEFLLLLTEIDPDLHFEVERGHFNHVTHSDRAATIWFVNGRVFPDMFQGNYNSLYPHQPYQALVMTHPGDRVLVREVNAGHDSHPFHHHGENMTLIARDGRPLTTDGITANLGRSDNTLNMAPKQTIDSVWQWTGKGLNWDAYGPVAPATGPGSCTDANHDMVDDTTGDPCHDDICDANDLVNNRTGAAGPDGFDDDNWEYCPDHGKDIPVTLPGVAELSLGGWWSGSPFMGDVGDLPPGEGGLNPFGGYFMVWHSHNEKELTTFDIFPGGSLDAVAILPPAVPID